MKKILFITAALSTLAATASADDFYGSVSFGIGKTKPKVDGSTSKMKSGTPMVGDIALGTYLNQHMRSEFAASYHTGSSKNSSAGFKVKETGYAGMLNFYYDFLPNDTIIPYVTAGLGYGKNKFKISGANVVTTNKPKSKGGFAYQAGLGVDFNVEAVKLGLGYRLRSFGSSKSGNNYTLNGTALNAKPKINHLLVLGARYDF